MPDREKLIKEYENYVNSYISLTTSHDYEFEMHKAVLALLKEQEKQKFFVDEDGKVTPLPVVVRCKECKKWHVDCLPICGRHGCDVLEYYTRADDYCSFAERKEGGEAG